MPCVGYVVLAVAVFGGCGASAAVGQPTVSSPPVPEPIARVPEPNPLELYPRRAGAKAWDFEAKLGDVVELGDGSVVTLKVAQRTGPLDPRTRAEFPRDSRPDDDGSGPSLDPARPAAFVVRRAHDRRDGLRVVIDVDISGTWLFHPETLGTGATSTSPSAESPPVTSAAPTSGASISSTLPVAFFTDWFPLDCQLTILADGSVTQVFIDVVTANDDTRSTEHVVTFAVGQTDGPFALECESPMSVLLFSNDTEYRRVVWRIDA
jgi:hypothetical protein